MERHISALLALVVLFATVTLSQEQTVDVLHLKNGSVIRGQVTELSTSNIKIKTADGSLFVYAMADVDKMETETVSPKSLTVAPENRSPVASIVPKDNSEVISRTEPVEQSNELPSASPKQEGIRFGLRGGLFGSLQIWDHLEGTPDSKIGLGLMGTLTGGVNLDDDMYFGVGPLLGGSFHSQSEKILGYQTTTTVNAVDFGVSIVGGFDDMFLLIGFGSAQASVTAEAGGESETVDMPDSAPYRRVTLGFADGFGFGVSYVSYSDWARNLSRFEINLGLAF
jgi:hypothetical protein